MSLTIPSKLLILRQGGEVIPKANLKGCYNNADYLTIGYGLKANIHLVYKLPIYFFSGVFFLLRWKQKGHINYLYCYNGPNVENILFIIFAKMIGYLIIFDIVEDFSYNEEELHSAAKVKNYSEIFFDKYITKLANGIVVISRYLESKYNKYNFSIPIKLITASTPCKSKESVKEKFGNPIKFIYAGSFGKKDGIKYLIDAFEKVHKKYRDSVLFLSGKGKNLSELKSLLQEKDGILYVGYLEPSHFDKFLEEGDVMCMTRTNSQFSNAGFPFKLAEYLATGNPVIASDVGDVRLYLSDKEDVLLVDPCEPSSIAKAMEYCIRNQEEAIKIGLRGMEKCKKYFNAEQNGRLLIDLFREVFEQKRRVRRGSS